MIVSSAFIELIFEAVVDAFALDLEAKNGIDLDVFWKLWKVNPLAFWGLAVTDNMLAILLTTNAFKQFPSIAFCTSPTDACTCKGGGFEIYKPFCNTTVVEIVSRNGTSSRQDNVTISAEAITLQHAKVEYTGLFEALSADITILVVRYV